MATTDERLNYLEQQVSTIAAKVDMLVAESQQQREDIRHLNEKHAAEMKALDEKINANAKEFFRRCWASGQLWRQSAA